MVSFVLDEPDPDKYFVGKKSTKEDGRRSRLQKAPAAPAPSTGGSTEGLCTEETKEDCAGGGGSGDPAGGAAKAGPKSVVVNGPGGAKWEIFQNEDGSWPPEANMPANEPPPPPPPPPPPSPKKSTYVKPQSKIVNG